MVDALARRYGIRSRERKWELYQRLYPPREGERILDVGASKYTELPWENWFLRRYPYPGQITAVVVDGAEDVHAAFPDVTVVEADGRDLPFGDGEFDVVHSNAVIEHVGEREEQRRFVAEVVRVGRHGFLTTPNRWFPIEAHSRLPLLHWLPRQVAWKLQHAVGCHDADAWLLSPRTFRDLFPGGTRTRIYRQRLGGMTATIVAVY